MKGRRVRGNGGERGSGWEEGGERRKERGWKKGGRL